MGSDSYWLVDSEKNHFIGEICIRHRLDDTLRLALDSAKARSITSVPITCDDNFASARGMEKNGFKLSDKVEVEEILIRGYWKTL